MSSQRPPLGVSSVSNVHTSKAATTKAKPVAGTEKPTDDASRIARLHQEVEGLRGRVARRDETIAKLQASAGSNSSAKELQSQLEDLTKRHTATKAKHRSELDDLAAKNRKLGQEVEKHGSRESHLTAKLADVRAKLALSEAEARRAREDLASRPIPQAGPAIDERLAWRKEKTAMEAELGLTKKELDKWMDKCGRLESDSADNAVVRAENERLRYGWSVMAEQYGQLYELLQDTVQARRTEASSSTQHRLELEDQLKLATGANDEVNLENADLREQLDLARDEVEMLSITLYEALTTRQVDQPCPISDTGLSQTDGSLAPSVDLSHMEFALDLAIGHAELERAERADAGDYLLTLTSRIIELEQAVRNTEAALATAQNAMTLLREEHGTLKGEHASCGPTISQLRFDAEQADRVIQRRGQEVQDVRLELQRATRASERQADMIKSASDEVSRAKYAQDVLEEEVENLRARYIEAADFEEKYQDLLEQQALLETREAIAIEQAERVAMENAELMGHPDGSSRIGYVDGVRREMAMCRQELASTRHHLNSANDRIASLENEISAYKSISPDSALGASRTRVVRRQPEGGRLTTSTSAGGSRRVAVSGPGGAVRFV